MTGDIAHHAAKSLVFPLPAPGSVPKRAPLPWDTSHPFAGLGYVDMPRPRRGRRSNSPSSHGENKNPPKHEDASFASGLPD
jgi:hypothetical protein